MPDFGQAPAFILAFFTLCLTIGGFFALRHGYSKEAAEIEGRVITGLGTEIAGLRRKIEDLEKDRDRQDRILSTIRYALKQRGLKITIDGEYVTLEDSSGKSKVTRIQTLLSDGDEEDEK